MSSGTSGPEGPNITGGEPRRELPPPSPVEQIWRQFLRLNVTMKIVATVLVLWLLSFIFAGCGPSKATTSAPAAAPVTATLTVTATPEPAPTESASATPTSTDTSSASPEPSKATSVVRVALPKVVAKNGAVISDELENLGLTKVSFRSTGENGAMVILHQNWVGVSIEPRSGSLVKPDQMIVVTVKRAG